MISFSNTNNEYILLQPAFAGLPSTLVEQRWYWAEHPHIRLQFERMSRNSSPSIRSRVPLNGSLFGFPHVGAPELQLPKNFCLPGSDCEKGRKKKKKTELVLGIHNRHNHDKLVTINKCEWKLTRVKETLPSLACRLLRSSLSFTSLFRLWLVVSTVEAKVFPRTTRLSTCIL